MNEQQLERAQAYHSVAECLPAVRHIREHWYRSHVRALAHPVDFERAIVHGLQSWLDYAGVHARAYSSLIGDDGVIGKYWQEWGLALRGLLNGTCGRLDCGTVDGFILRVLADHGVDTESL